MGLYILIESTIGRVSGGEDLSMQEMADTMDLIMQGRCGPAEIALLLTALRAKGESVAEVAGAALAMRRNMTRIGSKHSDLIDTCGTGGDGSGTFNISTAAALVAAASGAKVAKHGNRRVSSKTGSADVLAALGVNVDARVDQVEACLEQLGICFCFAPLLHPSMKNVAEVRRQLGVPTIFNLLGPLTNPAGAKFQLVGVGKAALRPLLAEALSMLGVQRALVVCGEDGMDEVTLGTGTQVTEVADEQIREFRWTPNDFGLPSAGSEAMQVDGPAASAAMIREILAGHPGPPRDVVVLNAAAALWTAGQSDSPAACARSAQAAIDTGAAQDLLSRLAQVSAA